MDRAEQSSVLLVEDDPTLRSTLAFNLTREGYNVLTADNGERALELVRDQGDSLDLLILDIMLPGINGFQVLQRVRRRGLQIPVLMLSARGEEQDKVDGLELGADDYVVKPFALRELLARVRAALRRRAVPAARPPGVLRRGELRIEPERRRASVGNCDLQLRPKEFGLLVALALEPGRVFGRQELLDHIWGDDVIVDERTVDVHISWLRGKLLDAGMEESCIRTVYGAGYCFEVSGEPQSTAPQLIPEAQGGTSRDFGTA
ncbi:MAG: response regulator transcription factor [Chloroflexota bacterium]|nr:response regulator transcription factor [Chloroflexota bacterium]